MLLLGCEPEKWELLGWSDVSTEKGVPESLRHTLPEVVPEPPKLSQPASTAQQSGYKVHQRYEQTCGEPGATVCVR